MKHNKLFRTDLMYFGCTNKHQVVFNENDVDVICWSTSSPLGELGHLNRYDVNLSYVSHQILNLKVEHGVLRGDIRVLETPRGQQLATLLDANSIVFRPRVIFQPTSNGAMNFFKIRTFDAVDKRDDCFEAYRFRRKKLLKIKSKIK